MKHMLFIAPLFAVIFSLHASAASYVCVNDQNDLITFSANDSMEFSDLKYQRINGEFVHLPDERLRVKRSSSGVKVMGTWLTDASISGLSVSLPENSLGSGVVRVKVKFTDGAGMPVASDIFECGVVVAE